jgi:trimethylamine---corrinoid protein Co-methyltransferase
MRRNLHAGHRGSGGLRLEMFTSDELDDLHLATLDVLERTGIFVETEEAREILAGAGCRVGDDRVVHIPGHVVEDAVAAAPSRLVCCGRDPKDDTLLEAGRVTFCNFGQAVLLYDVRTGEPRKSVLSDLGDSATLIDALPDIDILMGTLAAPDAPVPTANLYRAAQLFSRSSKHAILAPGGARIAQYTREMAAAAAGYGSMDEYRDRPTVMVVICPVSPLKLIGEVCDVIIDSARAGTPQIVLSAALGGVTAPVHLAGAIVLNNAEVLAGIALAQLTRKGTPVVYGSSTTASDLRYASASVGSPECGLINAGLAALTRRYRLPSILAGL